MYDELYDVQAWTVLDGWMEKILTGNWVQTLLLLFHSLTNLPSSLNVQIRGGFFSFCCFSVWLSWLLETLFTD